MKRIAIVGFGAIGRSIVDNMTRAPTQAARLVAVCMRDSQLVQGRRELPHEVLATNSLVDLMALDPDIVVEAAGHTAVAECGPLVLGRGRELFILSTGALADDVLRLQLLDQAGKGGGRIGIPSGALAGFDGLLSLREAGLRSVTYRSIKPPVAWLGTEAERSCNLAGLERAQIIFSGSAREAALRFPKNANLAVAVALAGLGLEKTHVELVADPRTRVNTGHLLAKGASSTLEVELTNSAFDSNPKTSEITGLSVVAAFANRAALISYC